MLQEDKSLQHTKVYLSNRNLRVCTFQDELEHDPNQPGSKISLIATNNNSVSKQLTPNMLIGDADTFFLLRENEKYQQQINELIDEMQANNMKQSEQNTENQQLREQLDELRTKNNKNSSTMNLLSKISKQLIKALKIKSMMSIKMANIIKKLENSLQNMKIQLVTVTLTKEQIQQKYAELQIQMQMYLQKTRNRIQSQMQTETISFQHFCLQVENEPIQYKQMASQSQSVINHQKSSQTSLQTHSQKTNTIQIQVKECQCQTQKAFFNQQSLQVGSSITSLAQIAQQTNQYLMSSNATQSEAKELVEVEVQSEELQQTLKNESQTQTNEIETQSTSISTQIGSNKEKNIQTEPLNNLKLQRNLIDQIINLISLKQESKQSIPIRKQLNIVHEVSIQIQQKCHYTFQTEVTEEDDLSLKVGFTDREVNQNILGYFKQINSKNQINYNEQIVRDLEEKGQNQASKALAKLMKQHMCLKLCLNRLMQKQGEQLQSQNEKMIEVFQQSLKHVQKSPTKKGTPQKEQCTIY